MNKLLIGLTVTGLISSSTLALANGDTIVSDSFESGDFSVPSAPGFRWSTNSSMTSIVTSTTEVFRKTPINEPRPAGSNWEAKNGDHALRLLYNPGQHWTEQKFYFSEPQPEIWMSFWLRVPTNYSHPKTDGADNQKLFRIWMDGYGSKGEGSTVGTSFRGDGTGGSYFFAKVNKGDHQGTGPDKSRAPFISVPSDRGRWMHFVVHAKSESLPDADDGLFQIWRKWEGEPEYTNTHDLRQQPIKVSSKTKGFAAGYLMGYANAAYPEITEFLIDDFELSTSPLFLDVEAPEPPSNLLVK